MIDRVSKSKVGGHRVNNFHSQVPSKIWAIRAGNVQLNVECCEIYLTKGVRTPFGTIHLQQYYYDRRPTASEIPVGEITISPHM